MTANLENIHEIYNIFCQKNRMNADIINLFDHFHLSQTLRHLKMEKQQGVSASLLIVLLCLFRMCHESIGSFYSRQFYGLFQSGKNCFYRMYNRSSMDWRKLLLRMSVRFMSILKEEGSGDLSPDHLHRKGHFMHLFSPWQNTSKLALPIWLNENVHLRSAQ